MFTGIIEEVGHVRHVQTGGTSCVLTVAAAKGADTLVLGAFGCGAFHNNPAVVADAYRTVLKEFAGIFRKIEFAVFCQPWAIENYELFAQILQP